MQMLPKPPSNRTETGWPAPEDMFRYFSEVHRIIDMQSASCKHDIDRYYPHPRAYKIVDNKQKTAQRNFDEVVQQYKKVLWDIPDPVEQKMAYNMRMVKFFAQMGEQFRQAIEMSSIASLKGELYRF